jgi:hypothetical protein
VEQISDPKHYGRKVIDEFVRAGAPEEIAYVSKPHIGTFRLVSMVEQMRATIESLGGQIRFSQRVDDLLVETDRAGTRHVRGVTLDGGEQLPPTTSCSRSTTARATRSRCCMHAAFSSKPNRSRSASASNIRNH